MVIGFGSSLFADAVTMVIATPILSAVTAERLNVYPELNCRIFPSPSPVISWKNGSFIYGDYAADAHKSGLNKILKQLIWG